MRRWLESAGAQWGQISLTKPGADAVLRAENLQPDVAACPVVAGAGDECEAVVAEGQQRGKRVDVAGGAEEVGAAVGADGVDLGDLAAGDPADRIEVMHAAVTEHATRRGAHAAGHDVRPAAAQPGIRARPRCFTCRDVPGVEAALEAYLHYGRVPARPCDHFHGTLDVRGDRLLAENREARLHTADDELGVRVRRRGDHQGVNTAVKQRAGGAGQLNAEPLRDRTGTRRIGIRNDHRVGGDGLPLLRGEGGVFRLGHLGAGTQARSWSSQIACG